MVTEEDVTRALRRSARLQLEGSVEMALDQGLLVTKPLAGLVDLEVENPETVGGHTYLSIVLGDIIGGLEGLTYTERRRLYYLLYYHSVEEVENDNDPIIERGDMSLEAFIRFQLRKWKPQPWRQWREGMIVTYHTKVVPALEKILPRYPEEERPLVQRSVQDFYLAEDRVADLARQVHLVSKAIVPVRKVLDGSKRLPAEAFVRSAAIVRNGTCRAFVRALERRLVAYRENGRKARVLHARPA